MPTLFVDIYIKLKSIMSRFNSARVAFNKKAGFIHYSSGKILKLKAVMTNISII